MTTTPVADIISAGVRYVMASKQRSFTLHLPGAEAYAVVQRASAEIPKYRCEFERQERGELKYRRGWGLTNPVEMFIRMQINPDGTTTVTLDASILALADPFGFLTGALDQFEGHIQAHAAARQTGQPVAPPTPDRRGLYVTLGGCGCMTVAITLAFGFLVLANLL